MPAPAKSAAAKIELYFENVDALLAGLTAAESRTFLAAQVERWTRNLSRFIEIIDADKPMPGAWVGADVVDFHATLARLAALQAQFSEKVAA